MAVDADYLQCYATGADLNNWLRFVSAETDCRVFEFSSRVDQKAFELRDLAELQQERPE
ncbi:MAG: hypothetical protein AAGH76_00490 [Pseudomonadota bacterium]